MGKRNSAKFGTPQKLPEFKGMPLEDQVVKQKKSQKTVEQPPPREIDSSDESSSEPDIEVMPQPVKKMKVSIKKENTVGKGSKANVPSSSDESSSEPDIEVTPQPAKKMKVSIKKEKTVGKGSKANVPSSSDESSSESDTMEVVPQPAKKSKVAASPKNGPKPDSIKANGSAKVTAKAKSQTAPPTQEGSQESFVLLANFDKHTSQKDVRQLLSSHGLLADRVHMVYTPVAILSVSPGAVEPMCSKLQGLQHKSHTLSCIPLNQDAAGLFQHHTSGAEAPSDNVKDSKTVVDSKSLFIRNVPGDVTMEEISSAISNQTAVITLLKKKKKDPELVTGVKVTFPSASKADAAFKKLQGATVRGMELDVKHFIEQNTPSASHQTVSKTGPESNNACILEVGNLPFAFTEEQIAEEFPDAVGVKLIMRNGRNIGICHVTYKSAKECLEAKQASQDKTIGGRLIRVFQKSDVKPQPERREMKEHSDFIIRIFNIPFDASEDELKKHYKDAQRLVMLKLPDGRFRGMALAFFQNEAQCQKAIKATEKVNIRGRQLTAVINDPHASQKGAPERPKGNKSKRPAEETVDAEVQPPPSKKQSKSDDEESETEEESD